MANVVAPKGFVPVRHLDGAPYNGQHSIFMVPAADGTAIFVGDVVVYNGSAGSAGKVVAGMDMEGVPQVIVAASGTTGQNIAGVVVGFLPDPTNLMLKHRAASTDRVALVVTDPTVIYEAQEDAVTTPLAAADIELNVAFTLTAGSTATGVSKMAIQSTSKATTATLPFKLLGLSKRVGNAFNVAGAGTDPGTFEVMLNTSVWALNVAGIA